MIFITILLKILAVLLCILLSLLIVLMFIPFEYSLKSRISEVINFEAKIFWMFHLLNISFSKEDSHSKVNFFIANKRLFSMDPTKKSKYNKKEKKHNKKLSKQNKNFFKRKFLSYVISYFKDIFKIIKPKSVEIKGIYGFYDPSITGFLCGLTPILAQIIPVSNINLQPVFDDEIIDIEASMCGKIILFFIIYRTLKFILKKEVRKILFKKSKTAET